MRVRPRHELMDMVTAAVRGDGYVDDKVVEEIALRLRLPSSRVYGFITQFEELPRKPSSTRVRVCTGPACVLNGAKDLYGALANRLRGEVDVLADPGLGSWHASPAVRIEPSGGEAFILEGPSAWSAGEALSEPVDDKRERPGFVEGDAAPAVRAMPGSELSPWCAEMTAGSLPEGWTPGLYDWVRDHPEEALARIGAGEAPRRKMRGDQAEMLKKTAFKTSASPVIVCDSVGEEAENNTSYAVTLLNPRSIAAGATLAGAACAAGEVIFYLPWNDSGMEAAMRNALDEIRPLCGIDVSIRRGPSHIPTAFEIGRAGVMQGIMLWQAASFYGWGDISYGDRPLVLIPADMAWRLPWLLSEDGGGDPPWAGNRILGFAGHIASPCLLEVPADIPVSDVVSGLDLRPGNGRSLKAIHLGGSAAGPLPPGAVPDRPLGKGAEVLLLDSSVCMVRWALYLADRAERRCCGGCTPGRLAPKVAMDIIRAVLEGDARGSQWTELSSVLEKAAELALCPGLKRGIDPVMYCLTGFGDEFEAHYETGECLAGSCDAGGAAAG